MSAPQDPDYQLPPPPPSPEAEPQGLRPSKQLWPIAIGVFVVGLLLVVSGVTKLLAGATGGGGALCFLGVVLFALGFVRLPLVPNPEAPLSWIDRLTAIFYEPSRVFRNLRSNPAWIAPFVLVWVLSSIYSTAFIQRITPQRIVDHAVEKSTQAFSLPPEAVERIRNEQTEALTNPVARVGSLLQAAVAIYVVTAFISALCFLGLLVFGGRANFWQVFSVLLHAAVPIVIITKLLGLLILFLKSPEDLHPILNQDTTLQDNLSILFSPATNPVLFVIASYIGLTSFYGLWLRAKGLHLGSTRVSSGAGWGVALTLFFLSMLLWTIVSALFAPFIS